MSPLNCSKGFLEYNDCLNCRHRHDNECWSNNHVPVKLADILTTQERFALLEARPQVPPVNIVTITKEDYQQLQRLILSLKEKLESHIEKTTKGKTPYEYDKVVEGEKE